MLLTIRDKSTQAITTLSTDPSSLSLEQAARVKSVKKYSMQKEQDSLKIVEDLLCLCQSNILDSASTLCSTASQLDTKRQANSFGPVKAFEQEDKLTVKSQ